MYSGDDVFDEYAEKASQLDDALIGYTDPGLRDHGIPLVRSPETQATRLRIVQLGLCVARAVPIGHANDIFDLCHVCGCSKTASQLDW